MRRTVLTFGLISGCLAIGLMFVTVPLINAKELGKSDVLGYSSMLLAALLVFFGIRSYRENAGGGRLTFGRGLAVGLLITVVSCACYAVGFEIMYFMVVPDFGDTFSACMVDRVRASGGTAEQIEAVTQQAVTLKRLYDNPWTNAALTFATSFPVGLVGSLISAAILRKR